MQLHHPRRAFAALAAALLAACADMPSSPASDPAGPADKRTPTAAAAPFYSGAFLGDAETTPERIGPAIREFAAKSGRHPALVKTFHDLDCDFSAAGWCGQLLRAVRAEGSTPYLAIDVRWNGAPTTGLLQTIAQGGADARLAQVARDLRDLDVVVLLEPAWEMNGDWAYPWQGVANGSDAAAPAHYAAAWRRIVDVFRREGATQVRWVFNPNVGNPVSRAATGSAHWNWFGHYYPGDAYVDYVGAHGFNAPRLWGGPWHTFTEMFEGAAGDHILPELTRRFPGKPILLGEIASDEGEGSAKGRWISEAYRRMLEQPNVIGAVWFNMDKETDWRIDSSAASLKAFRSAVASPRVRTAFEPLPTRTRLAGR